MRNLVPGSMVEHDSDFWVVIEAGANILLRDYQGETLKHVAAGVELNHVETSRLQTLHSLGFASATYALSLQGVAAPFPAVARAAPVPSRSILEPLIARHGWAVTVARCGSTTGWTVGLHHKELPEMVLSGLPLDLGTALINEVATKLVELKARGQFEAAKPQPLNMTNWNFPLFWVPVDRLRAEAAFTEAGERSCGQAVYAQLVLPDPNCFFPWDSDYSRRMRAAQTYYGNGRVPGVYSPKRIKVSGGEEEWRFEGALTL